MHDALHIGLLLPCSEQNMPMACLGNATQHLESALALIRVQDLLVVYIVDNQKPFAVCRIFEPLLHEITHICIS